MAAHRTLELVAVIDAIVSAVNRIALVMTIATVVIAIVHVFMRGHVAPLGMVPWCKSHTIAREKVHSSITFPANALQFVFKVLDSAS